jgi:hypothetical protein
MSLVVCERIMIGAFIFRYFVFIEKCVDNVGAQNILVGVLGNAHVSE